MSTLIDIGKKETLCLQVDDKDLLQGLSRLKKNYENMESQLDAGYSCKIGDMEMEYDMSEKGFKALYKDMKSYYDGMIKDLKSSMKEDKSNCDQLIAELKDSKDSLSGKIKALEAEVENRDSADIVRTKAKELSTLVASASQILNCDADSLWELPESEIKTKVINKVYPKLNTDGESDVALDAMYKTCEFYKEDSKTIINRQKEMLNNVVRLEDNIDTTEPAIPARYKQKTNAWASQLGGVN